MASLNRQPRTRRAEVRSHAGVVRVKRFTFEMP
jgi:hypothetical protein